MDVNKTYRMRMAKQEDRAAGHDEDAQRDREAKDAAQVDSLRAELGSEEYAWCQRLRECPECEGAWLESRPEPPVTRFRCPKCKTTWAEAGER